MLICTHTASPGKLPKLAQSPGACGNCNRLQILFLSLSLPRQLYVEGRQFLGSRCGLVEFLSQLNAFDEPPSCSLHIPTQQFLPLLSD